jgi:outer membrane protein OmpA-like peptidoglycan-associated protein
MDLRCQQSEWTWEGGPCTERPTVVYFNQGSSELDMAARALLKATAAWMGQESSRFKVDGYSAPKESARAAELAATRAERVAQALREAGVPRKQIVLGVTDRSKARDSESVGRVEIGVVTVGR